MMRHDLGMELGLAMLCLLIGCGGGISTKLDRHFAERFRSFEAPAADKIKTEGVSREFPYASYDTVWDAATVVVMQNWIVVHANNRQGVIAAVSGQPASLPMAVLVEKRDPVVVHLRWMTELFGKIDEPSELVFDLSEENKNELTKVFFDKLSTQVYAGEKWKYLGARVEEVL